MTHRVSRFQRGSAVYTCRVCGKRTRETGDSESFVFLCAACYEEAGWENEHQDGYHEDQPNPSCPFCKEEDQS